MAMDGFITGLANTLKEGVDQRRKKADEYYEKQLEIARTTGLRNMKESQGRVNTSVAFANKLTQKGVPKDIIMAVAQANPEGLGDFEETITKMELDKGGRITDQEYRDLVKIKGEFVGKDKDFVTFFRDIHDPFIASTKDKESHEYDPRGSILGRMFAVNEMDKADKRLDTKVVAGGKTAAELLQYGDEYIAQPSTSVSVDFDPSTVDAMAREAAARKKALSGGDGLSIPDLKNTFELAKAMVGDVTTRKTNALSTDDLQKPEKLVELQLQVLEEVSNSSGIDKLESEAARQQLRSSILEQVRGNIQSITPGVEVPDASPTIGMTEKPASDEQGKPMPNTTITFRSGDTPKRLLFEKEDADGNYIFRDQETNKRIRLTPQVYEQYKK